LRLMRLVDQWRRGNGANREAEATLVINSEN
jgi:hypothetical protein